MANDLSAVPDVLFGTWKQLSGIYVDLETGEERPGLSKAPNGYIHFARDGRMFNLTVDLSRQRPAGARPTAAEAEALYRSLIAYTGYVRGRRRSGVFRSRRELERILDRNPSGPHLRA